MGSLLSSVSNHASGSELSTCSGWPSDTPDTRTLHSGATCEAAVWESKQAAIFEEQQFVEKQAANLEQLRSGATCEAAIQKAVYSCDWLQQLSTCSGWLSDTPDTRTLHSGAACEAAVWESKQEFLQSRQQNLKSRQHILDSCTAAQPARQQFER
jgi:hypothetical protein